MPAPSDDPVGEAENKVAGLQKKLEGVEKQLADLEEKKTKGWDWLESNAELTHDQLETTFRRRDFKVNWEEVDRCDLLTKLEEVLDGPLEAKIAKKEDEKKRLQDSHTKAQDVLLEEKKLLSEKEKQVTADKQKEAAEVQGKKPPIVCRPEDLDCDPWRRMARVPVVRERDAAFEAMKAHTLAWRSGGPTAWTNSKEGSRSKVWTVTGPKGCGKTALLGTIVVKLNEEDWIEGYRGVYVTYNDTTTVLEPREGELEVLTFARQMLSQLYKDQDCNLAVENLDGALDLVRQRLGMKANECLVVCVDEVVLLRERATSTISALKRYSDNSHTGEYPTLFVFSSLTESFISTAATLSGRKCDIVYLPNLSEGVQRELMPEVVKQRFDDDPQFQLLLSIVDGHPRAFWYVVNRVVDAAGLELAEDSDLSKAVRETVEECSFGKSKYKVQLRRTVAFAIMHPSLNLEEAFSSEDRELATRIGWLQPTGTTEFTVPPLILRYFAGLSEKASEAPKSLEVVLRKVYEIDFSVRPNHEIDAERMLTYYDAVKKAALQELGVNTCRLQQFYNGAAAENGDMELALNKDPPGVESGSHEDCIKKLRSNKCARPDKSNEPGWDFATPLGESGGVEVVALVQVKYGERKVAYNDVLENLMADTNGRKESFKKKLLNEGFSVVPVLSTVNEEEPSKEVLKSHNAVVFSRTGMHTHLKPLGPTRFISGRPIAAATKNTKSKKSYSTCAWTPCTPPPLSGLLPNAHLHTRQWRGIHTLATRRALPFAGRPVARGAVGGFLSLLARN